MFLDTDYDNNEFGTVVEAVSDERLDKENNSRLTSSGQWVVLIGGGRNHRMGLFDMVMIKDNHISVAGGVKDALRFVNLYLEKNNLHMEVEDKRLRVKGPVRMPTKVLHISLPGSPLTMKVLSLEIS
ncbi:hypothetical protein LOK49_LG15G02245 [Camellia lanceoleosa]|uniref:Uncharacterized protein n=1 Tax=Camellia lanceoleosa TaxID=1840588 RepID=A0ACC0F2R1_9ERIC|nr:hypothetical protein LOK49_LG15G02245 [Camellia lanceoleosa]